MGARSTERRALDEAESHEVKTVPPPPDADDPYSAQTTVGRAPAELLALVRAAEEGTLDVARLPRFDSEPAQMQISLASSDRPRPVDDQPSARVIIEPDDVEALPSSRPLTAVRSRHEPSFSGAEAHGDLGKPLPPVAAIALLFAFAAAVLALLAR